MEYTGVTFKYNKQSVEDEVLMAFMAEIGFESFEDTEEGTLGYIQSKDFDEDKIKNVLSQSLSKFDIRYSYEKIEDQNWNKLWESNYESIVISDQCHIRAPFHDSMPDVKYEILIEPQMSFGTAHHETTSMILAYILEDNFEGMTVLDMGCGTGVLAILASMKGAQSLEAIDNDEWAYRNSIDNVIKNNISNVKVILGDASLLKDKEFDIIFANINRNILLNDMGAYFHSLAKPAKIYFSGFYESDLKDIQEKANSFGLTYLSKKVKNNWCSACFEK